MATDNHRVVLTGDHARALAKIVQEGAIQTASHVLGNHLATGEDGNVAQHLLAPIAEGGRLDGDDIDHAAQLIDHQGCQRFAIHILGNDQQLATATLRNLLHNRQRYRQLR